MVYDHLQVLLLEVILCVFLFILLLGVFLGGGGGAFE